MQSLIAFCFASQELELQLRLPLIGKKDVPLLMGLLMQLPTFMHEGLMFVMEA